MQNKIKLTVYIILSTFLFACGGNETNESSKLNIAVTSVPYKYLVERIGGENVNVYSAIPKGADPHHFEPEPRTIEKIEKSDCYFLVGGNFTFEQVLFGKMSSMNNSLMSIDLSKNIDLIGHDPHIWLSIKNLKVISGNILDGLIELLPQKEEIFRSNYNSLVDSLNNVDSLLAETINNSGMKYMVVNHSAWDYFARDYNLEEIAVQYGSKSTNAKELADYIDFIKKNDIKLIFADPEHSNNAMSVIKEQVDVNVEVIDPLPDNLLTEFKNLNNIIKKQYARN